MGLFRIVKRAVYRSSLQVVKAAYEHKSCFHFSGGVWISQINESGLQADTWWQVHADGATLMSYRSRFFTITHISHIFPMLLSKWFFFIFLQMLLSQHLQHPPQKKQWPHAEEHVEKIMARVLLFYSPLTICLFTFLTYVLLNIHVTELWPLWCINHMTFFKLSICISFFLI